MTSKRLVLVALVSALALAGCATPAEQAKPAPAAVEAPDIEGEWTMTRTLAETTVDNEGAELGFEQVRILTFSDITCEAEGECTGAVNSRNPENTDTSGVDGELTIAGGIMSYAFSPEPQDCLSAEGEVVVAEAWSNSTVHEVEIPADAEIATLTGTGTMTVTASEQGAAECGTGGERIWDLVYERTE